MPAIPLPPCSRARAVPIVNENDTVAVDEIKFGDNDTLAALVASLIEADALLLLSDVAGLYDRDPTQFPDARLIPIVETIDQRIEQRAGGVRTAMGTGGMTTKIQAAKICAGSGRPHDHRRRDAAPTSSPTPWPAIAGRSSCPKDAPLRPVSAGSPTASCPRARSPSTTARKSSLVDDGKSLLPAGVTHVSGHFHAGDLVRLADARAMPLPRALSITPMTNCPHHGPPHRRNRPPARRKAADEVIHRDNLVLDL